MTEETKREPQQKSRKQRDALWVTLAVLVFTLPILGLGVSVVYLWAGNAGPPTRWRRLKQMPSPGVEIVTGTMSTVYVRTAEGSLYGCKHRGGIQEPKKCWYEVQESIESTVLAIPTVSLATR